MRSAPPPASPPSRSSLSDASRFFAAMPGYRPLRALRTRGLPCEVLAMREGAGGFRRLCSLRLACVDDHASSRALVREAAILSRVHHPAILPAHDLLESNGWMALVLPFGGGFTVDRLATPIGNGPDRPDAQAALFVAHAVFDALAHAHGKKDAEGRVLVHGDVHPTNILVRRTGHVVLRGFRGTAPIPTARPDLNPRIDPGPYAAPELADGGPTSIASDLYGAAAVVWHLFVGRPPKSGESLSVAATRPDLPPEVAAVLDVCLSIDPGDRRLRATTVAATVRKAVNLHGARDNLERLYVSVLRRLPTADRDLFLGTLPSRCTSESSSPTQRFRRICGEDSSSVPFVEVVSPGQQRGLGAGSPPVASPSQGVRKVQPSTVELAEDDIVESAPLAPTEHAAKSPPDHDAPGAQPRSLPPVATDLGMLATRSSRGRTSAWHAATLAIVLLLMSASWMVGRHLVGPAWSSRSHASRIGGPVPASPALPESASPVDPGEPGPSATPSVTVPATPPSSSSQVLFHQSSLIVEGPPHGIVYLNGIPVGRTGERLVSSGCGLRFVRVGSETEDGGAHGFRWLNKGQPAMLPCGGSISLRGAPR